jgi:UDP-N-acetylmuramoyl-tripeptide--D-alanyl-D-alanine ligase
VVLVNNAQREHLEFMVSVEAVAHENGSAISALPDSGVAVYPIDDDYSAVWKALAKQRKTMTFSLDSDADVRCITADWVNGLWQVAADTPMGEISYSLTIAGRHNVKNSLAAVACALSANVPLHTIVAGLQDFSAVKGRSFTQTIHINGRDVLLIDDTYNSNPDSMKVAIDSLSEMAEPTLIVMGDMGEVGEQGLAFHAEAGEYAQKKGIQQLFALGTLSQEVVKHFKGAQHFETMDALLAAVSAVVGTTNSILVKGSRFMKMERVSSHIVALATNDKHISNNKISINNENNNNKEASHVA